MRSLASALAILATAVSSMAQVSEWHMDLLYSLASERLDPIVSPNGVGGHMHRIAGGSGFAAFYNYDNSRAANCTTASIIADKSNYWAPQLYWVNSPSSFVPLPVNMRFYYQLGRSSPTELVTAFPEGFKMLAGNPNSKVGTEYFQFTCMVNSDLITGNLISDNFNYNRDCPYGMKFEGHFPNCWDGINLFKPDNSHVSYLSSNASTQSGQCPWSHPVRIPGIMLEYTWRPALWAPGQALAGNLAWANGDTTGYGVHADFTNGWDVNLLQTALNNAQCAGNLSSQAIQYCEVFAPYYNPNAASACKGPDRGQMNEVGQSNTDLVPIPSLPGCNPLWGNTPTKPTCSTPPTNPNVTAQQGVTQSYFMPGMTNTSVVHPLPTTPGWQSMGCIKSSPNMLLGTAAYFDTQLTSTSCKNACFLNGKTWAAVGWNGTQADCQCGTGIDDNASVFPGQCTLACPGNSSELCGNNYVHEVFTLGPDTTVQPLAYTGCFVAGPANTTDMIDTATFSFSSSNMTNEYCMQTCANRGLTWAATSNSRYCFCGTNTDVGSGYYMGNSGCMGTCAGNSSEICGAWNTRFSVYNVTAAGITPMTKKVYPPGRKGCYTDPNSNGLSPGITWTSSGNMTVESCNYGCAELGYSLSGVTNGYRCRCGNAWIGGPLYPDSSCKTPCTGNANETCGDSYMTTELYNTSVALPQVQADIAARPIGWSGCFADQDGTVFPDYSRTDMSNSVERCKATCKGLSYTWSGVDNVYYCLCSNTDPKVSARLPSNFYCNGVCPGNKTETCGANGRYLEAYNLTVKAAPAPPTSTLPPSSTNSTNSTSPSNTTSSTPPATSSSAPSGPSSIGCFADGSGLNSYIYTGSYMDQATCVFGCQHANYSYAGLTVGNQCRCGNTAPQIHVGGASCQTPCLNNASQTCGGTSGNTQVWMTNSTGSLIDPWTGAAADSNGYMGCWADTTPRLLASSVYQSNAVTPETCLANCQAQGYSISGVESGNQCYCSNSVTANTLGQRVADSQCNLNCTGNSAETCGAKGRIAILYNRAGAQSSSSSSTPGSVGAANAQGYHGCFAIGSMTSATNPHLTSTTVMSAGLCQRYCAFNGYPLAGTQGGSACYCGTADMVGIQQPEASCALPCPGNKATMCGDQSTMSLYDSSTAAPGYQQDYVGCVKDSTSPHDLTTYSMTSASMSASACRAVCQAKGTTMYGTEHGSACFCGASVPGSYMVGDDLCNSGCTGNSTQMCGSTSYLSLYKYGWSSATPANFVTVNPANSSSTPSASSSSSSTSSTSSTISSTSSPTSSTSSTATSTSSATSSTSSTASSTSSTSSSTSSTSSSTSSIPSSTSSTASSASSAASSTSSVSSTTSSKSSSSSSSTTSTSASSTTSSTSKTSSPTSTTSSSTSSTSSTTSSSSSTTSSTSSTTSSTTTSSTPAASSTAISDPAYVGCFTDSPTSAFSDTMTMSTLTPAKCESWCNAMGFSYAGMSRGTTCACANSVTGLTKSTNGCTVACGGSSGTMCGGNTGVYSVYQVQQGCSS